VKYLWTLLIAWSFFVGLCFGLRWLSSETRKKKAIALVESELQIPAQYLEADVYNYLRGDFRVSLRTNAKAELSWTVNLPSHHILSWQTKTKEDSVLRSLLKNFNDQAKN
jgi:hypothetical protein